MKELTLEEAALAWAQGKRVEAAVIGGDEWLPIDPVGECLRNAHPATVFACRDEYRFRLAPEPPAKKWRTWGILDVRVGMLVKRIHTNNAQLIVGIKWPTHVDVGQSLNMTIEYLVEHYEHSTDGGKTWLPCGVEVDA
jgi:hypothetical protein